MGKILPGIFVAFENPKGGKGKTTLTPFFAGYVNVRHTRGKGVPPWGFVKKKTKKNKGGKKLSMKHNRKRI